MNQKKESILIVDDNDDMLNLLQRHLKVFKYHTYKASSVNEAINVLKYNIIDLLITDLNMPEVNRRIWFIRSNTNLRISRIGS
ncbi:histidine kinase [Flavobacterium hibernum]|uniref:Response regulatory domain-containing protein n=1 Tax=Flavobacterium hibernum TaxID=37752 RepID=A0ABX4C148_9FLAO|nr:hypothetical protein B0A73_16170 [Flavobacterium hibernum]STO18530.1 histidine kinase [Flavobacterium hibernum]